MQKEGNKRKIYTADHRQACPLKGVRGARDSSRDARQQVPINDSKRQGQDCVTTFLVPPTPLPNRDTRRLTGHFYNPLVKTSIRHILYRTIHRRPDIRITPDRLLACP